MFTTNDVNGFKNNNVVPVSLLLTFNIVIMTMLSTSFSGASIDDF